MHLTEQFARDLGSASAESLDIGRVVSIWQSLHDRSQQFLGYLLERYFEQCDDLFHDIYQRAQGAEKQQYFDGIRQLKLHKISISNAFKQSVTHAFRGVLQRRTLISSISPASPVFSVEDTSQLELIVSMRDMVSRTQQSYSDLIVDYSSLLGGLLNRDASLGGLNPLEPAIICEFYWKDCLELLDVGLKAKIILLKQFDRFFLTQLQPAYQQQIQLLHRCSILPVYSRAQQRVVVEAVGQSTTVAVDAERNTIPGLERLQALCAELKDRSKAPRKAQYIDHSQNPGPIMPTNQLTLMLQGVDPLVVLGPAGAEGPANCIQPIIKQLLTTDGSQTPFSLSANDDDIINLVAMFFDFVAEDENISLPIRIQLSRLQLLILKMALRDRQFFSNRSHPARRFINLLAYAGVGYNNDQYLDDPLYQRVNVIIERLSHSATLDGKEFTKALIDLNKAIKAEGLVEDEAPEQEESPSEQQMLLDEAIQIVNHELVERLLFCRIPRLIGDFLINRWRVVLVAMYLQKGNDDYIWESVLQVIDDLVWMCIPHEDKRSQQRMAQLKPDLISRLSAGLSMGFPSRSEYREELVEIIQFVDAVTNGEMRDQRFPELGRQQLQWLVPDSQVKSKEVSGVRFQDIDQENIDKVEDMPVGTWMEYAEVMDAAPFRCRLSSKRVHDGVYSFSDRYGNKLFEKAPTAFAYDLQNGLVRLLDRRPIFERTLKRISETLQGQTSVVFSPD